jgi:hypothetical protein
MEMDRPFDGVIKVPGVPLQYAFAQSRAGEGA